jgi:hypothetical protein
VLVVVVSASAASAQLLLLRACQLPGSSRVGKGQPGQFSSELLL